MTAIPFVMDAAALTAFLAAEFPQAMEEFSVDHAAP